MTRHEPASPAIAEIAVWASVASDVAAILAFCTSIAVVILMWWGIKAMVSANTARAAQAAEDRKAMQAQMQAQTAQQAKDAAEDRKAMQAQMQAQMAQQAKDAAEDRKAMQAQMAQQAKDAAEDRKAMQAQMAQAMTQMTQAAADANARMSEDRKVTQGLLKALENQGMVLESLIHGNGSARLKDRRGHAPRQPAPGE